MARACFIKYVLQLEVYRIFYTNRTLSDVNRVKFVAKIVKLIENDLELKRFEAVKAI